jgi:ketosteroid isomerase-like protein
MSNNGVMDTTSHDIAELEQTWAAAEQAAGSHILDSLAAEGLVLVGPFGFILNKRQWLERYSSGALRTTSLDWVIESLIDYGDCAIIIGTHTQTGDHRGRAIDGSFRSTHVWVGGEGRWQLASIHLSPIQQPPGHQPAIEVERS